MRGALVFASVLSAAGAWAHGGGGGAEIDDHHAALRDALQMQLGDDYDRPVDLESADLSAGETLYGMHCESCHGVDGRGDGPAAANLSPRPSDLTDGAQMQFISDAGFLEVLRAGLPQTGMPAYEQQLDDTERLDVYAWTKTLRTYPPADDGHDCTARPGSKSGPIFVAIALGIWGAFRRKQR